jgi:hypothetical protein
MTCIPQSGGCERPFTEAFVEHLNQTGGCRYVHRACSDVASRQVPQPEALYEDSGRNMQLVIERKSISWPIDYPYRHKKSHITAEQFSKELSWLPSDDLYEVRLPMLLEGTETELQGFALKASRQIRSNWQRVAAGSALRGNVDGRWPWAFGRVPDWEREENAPRKGLKFTFVGGSSLFNFIDPANLPHELSSAVQEIYSRCVKKFASYSQARRVLALDPHGDLRHQGTEWWKEVFFVLQPPAEIDEIWSATFDWLEEDLEGWTFERLQ